MVDNSFYSGASIFPDVLQGGRQQGRKLGYFERFGQKFRRQNWLQFLIKRMFDIFVSLSALVVLSPLFVFVAIAIRRDSPGPVFFRQIRWGRDCQPITVFKFRTMQTDLCDRSGVAQTIEGDPRVTRIGAFLRRTSIDELPQLFNVLRGDMSLVGPRCHAIGMLAGGKLYEELVPDYHQRHAVRPGITGLAQMRGLRGPTISAAKARARIASDLYYVQNHSVMMDLVIILTTIKTEITRGTGF
jgi:lipopolysaccharide/colanic/teichoic acid biosynthesis glycosyltransferase